VAGIDPAAMRVADTPLIEDLQENVEDFRRSLSTS
jgi:hypothetical protein